MPCVKNIIKLALQLKIFTSQKKIFFCYVFILYHFHWNNSIVFLRRAEQSAIYTYFLILFVKYAEKVRVLNFAAIFSSVQIYLDNIELLDYFIINHAKKIFSEV